MQHIDNLGISVDVRQVSSVIAQLWRVATRFLICCDWDLCHCASWGCSRTSIDDGDAMNGPLALVIRTVRNVSSVQCHISGYLVRSKPW